MNVVLRRPVTHHRFMKKKQRFVSDCCSFPLHPVCCLWRPQRAFALGGHFNTPMWVFGRQNDKLSFQLRSEATTRYNKWSSDEQEEANQLKRPSERLRLLFSWWLRCKHIWGAAAHPMSWNKDDFIITQRIRDGSQTNFSSEETCYSWFGCTNKTSGSYCRLETHAMTRCFVHLKSETPPWRKQLEAFTKLVRFQHLCFSTFRSATKYFFFETKKELLFFCLHSV